MPHFKALLTGFAAGDSPSIRRTIRRHRSKLADGVTVTKAWLTIKTAFADVDNDALVQKEITTVDAPGTGRIENDGTGNVNPVLRFDLAVADTIAIGTTARYFSIDVVLSTGGNHALESGDPTKTVLNDDGERVASGIYASAENITVATS